MCDCILITEADSKDGSTEANKILYVLIPAVFAPIVLIVMIVVCVWWCKDKNKLKLRENVEGGVAGDELGHEDQRGQLETDHNQDQGRASIGSGIDCGPLSDDRKPAKL